MTNEVKDKLLGLFFMVSLFASFSWALLQVPNMAHADTQTLHSSCQDNSYTGTLSNWNWVKGIQDVNSLHPNGGSTSMPSFNHGTSKYIIFKTKPQQDLMATGPSQPASYPNGSWNQYTIYIADTAGATIRLAQVTPTDQRVYVSSGSIRQYTINDGTNYNGRNVYGGSLISSGQSFNTLAIGCVQAAHNTTYDSTWTYTQFTADQGYNDERACATTDLACHIAGVFSGVADTFHAVGQAIVRGIGFLFMPTDKTQEAFSSLNTFLQEKLGFLVYPITFFVDWTNSLEDGGSWCNSTTCQKSFGNFLGHEFSVNLLMPKEVMPTYWNWLIMLIRAVTILALLLGIRAKLIEVTNK